MKVWLYVGIIVFSVVGFGYAKIELSAYFLNRARKDWIYRWLEGEMYSVTVELPYGALNSRQSFKALLNNLQADGTFNYALFGKKDKDAEIGDDPTVSFIARCPQEKAEKLKSQIRNVYSDATLKTGLPPLMLDAMQAYRFEHYPEPHEIEAAAPVVIEAEPQGMTTGNGLVGKFENWKAHRA